MQGLIVLYVVLEDRDVVVTVVVEIRPEDAEEIRVFLEGHEQVAVDPLADREREIRLRVAQQTPARLPSRPSVDRLRDSDDTPIGVGRGGCDVRRP